MNKKELIKHIEDLPYNEGLIVDTIKISRKGLLELVKQLDEPQKVTIPQVIAEYIKQKKDDDYHLLGAMIEIRSHKNKEIDEWFEEDDNMEIFARAWLDGYEVEKEKKYLVKFKKIEKEFNFLNFDTFDKEWKIFCSNNNCVYRTHHTRKELEEAGFGWVFNCEGIEIKEVTE